MDGAAPHLDPQVIAELRGVMGEEFGLLVETFTRDSEERLEHLRATLGAGDADALWRTAHSFKGSSGNVGAQRLSALCRELELAGRELALDSAPALLDAIAAEYTTVKRLLAAEGHPSPG